MVDWLHISQDSGNTGTTVVTITANTYSEITARTASLTVSTNNSNLSKSVQIRQEAREVITVYASPLEINASRNGGSYSFNILSNGNWEIEYSDWFGVMTESGSGNATVVVFIPENTNITDRNGYIRVSTIDNYVDIIVTQERAEITVDASPKSLTFIYTGGSQTINVVSNGPWTATTQNNWCTLSQTAGTGNTVVTVTTQHYEGNAKTNTITFSTADYSSVVNVVQFGVVPFLYFSDDTIDFNKEGGAEILKLNSNIDWNIEMVDSIPAQPISTDVSSISAGVMPDTYEINITTDYKWSATTTSDWITLSQTEGYQSATLIATVSKNEENDERNGIIVIETLTDKVNVNVTQDYSTISITPSQLIFESSGSSKTIIVDTYLKWTATTNDSWITIEQTTGDGQSSVPITVRSNKTDDIKIGSIQFYSENGYETELTIIQYTNYFEMPLTLEVTSAGDIKFGIRTAMTISFIINDGERKTYSGWNGLATFTGLTVGDKIKIVGTNAKTVSMRDFIGDGTTLYYKAYGNINSIYNETNFSADTECGNYYSFFDNKVTDASNLTLAVNCYQSMFSGCTSLTTVPLMLSTTLAQSCYNSMFAGCTSLTTAPELPVTTLADYCYEGMFNGCTSLTTAPELPATALTYSCYQSMFGGCTSLTTAPTLPATTLATQCYYYMFSRCTSLTTAPSILPATTLTSQCYYGMFSGCTGLTTAPELPATELTKQCYYSMFNGCSKINYIKCLATDISATDCTIDWVKGVASTGTFVKAASMSGWTTGTKGIPSGWTVVNNNN